MELAAYTKAFKEQCTCDPSFVPYILHEYPGKALSCGRHVYEKGVRWSYTIDPDREASSFEFLDFINGNGFIVKESKIGDIYHIYPILKDRSDNSESIHS